MLDLDFNDYFDCWFKEAEKKGLWDLYSIKKEKREREKRVL